MNTRAFVLPSFLLAGLLFASLMTTSATQAGTIVLVTNSATTDADLVSHLESLGHTVTTGSYTSIDSVPADLATLNAADLVLVSRNTSSGDYNGAAKIAAWDSITTPVLLGNAYLARTNRWSWVNTDGLNLDYAGDISAPAGTLAIHPFFDGVVTNDGVGDPAISGLSKYLPSTDTDVPAPGVVLGDGLTIAVTNDADPSNQRVYLASWQAGEMTGSGNVLGGDRYFYALPEYSINAMHPGGFQILDNIIGSVIQVPEPGTLILVATGVCFAACVRRHRRPQVN